MSRKNILETLSMDDIHSLSVVKETFIIFLNCGKARKQVFLRISKKRTFSKFRYY